MNPVEMSAHVKETHIKSQLDVMEEHAKKRTIENEKLLDKTIKNTEEKKQKRRTFIEIESAHLKNMGKLQTKIDRYRERNKPQSSIKDQDRVIKMKNKELLHKNNSTKLGLHLRAAGEKRSNQHFQAHHIVCSRHPGHAAARFDLFVNDMGYGINDPDNGVWLPTHNKHAHSTTHKKAVGHVYIHTDKYINWVEQKIAFGKNSRQSMELALGMLKTQLLDMDKETAKLVLTDDGLIDMGYKQK